MQLPATGSCIWFPWHIEETEIHIPTPNQKEERPPNNPVENLNWEVPTAVGSLPFQGGAASLAHMQIERAGMLTKNVKTLYYCHKTKSLFFGQLSF